MTFGRGQQWGSAFKAALKALVWGIIGPPLLYSGALFIVVVLYNVAKKPIAEILPVANASFIWSMYFGIVMAGPLGALAALTVTWQAFRWTARGDDPRRVTRKTLGLGALFGLLVPIWLALWLALVQATTFSGRFDSPFTFLYMATNSVPVAVFSTWILVRVIRADLRAWSPQRHA
ncbi:MAG TPA: hypothetical protein VFT63_05485 [bacterium]|nr:hypothetical protein [bacterium]